MQLKLLREHYQSKDGKTWYPKQGYDTEEEIIKLFKLDPEKSNIYTCTLCEKLHLASHPDTSKRVKIK
jgi:hypothetical protein